MAEENVRKLTDEEIEMVTGGTVTITIPNSNINGVNSKVFEYCNESTSEKTAPKMMGYSVM